MVGETEKAGVGGKESGSRDWKVGMSQTRGLAGHVKSLALFSEQGEDIEWS